MNSTLNHYIARRTAIGILIAFIIITGIIMLVDFVEITRNVGGEDGANMPTILGLTLLNAPRLVEETIAFVVLFGVMGVLYSLNRHAELTVMRASGLSAWRVLRPVIMVTGLLGLIWAFAFNPIAALSAQKQQSLIRSLEHQDISSDSGPVWLREGRQQQQVVIRAARAEPDGKTLSDVTFYYFDIGPNQRPQFSVRYDATRATLSSGFWLLHNVIENEDGKPPRSFESVSKTTRIDQRTLRTRTQSNSRPPIWQLQREIAKAEQAGYDPAPLRLQFHKLLSLPVLLIAMALIAASTAMGQVRGGGTFRLMVLGASIGFSMFFANSLIGAFGTSGVLPPGLAAWSVPVFVLLCGLFALSRTEDG